MNSCGEFTGENQPFMRKFLRVIAPKGALGEMSAVIPRLQAFGGRAQSGRTEFELAAPAALFHSPMLSRAAQPSGFIEPCLPSPAEPADRRLAGCMKSSMTATG